ncbi:hypothetical protein OESDEN_24209 [Oesophagostomum dentatum]|uniref:Uncharacterized protein n=1 Tax=Oesophagostomum dentatum TaxID=61180 RepID=A0A0B1RX35_OESDE|nr:hypothetical protein OESDEN_24209 [Oesophagostomum dentatum]
MPSFCCPTGCNYNMCLNLGFPPIPHLRRHTTALSSRTDFEECPDPYTLDIQCTARKHTSWCLTDAECPSVNRAHPRK